MVFTSQMSQQSVSVVPVVVSDNPRWVSFQVYLVAGSASLGYVTLEPAGTWNYQLLDNMGNLLNEDILNIEYSCPEVTFYEYVSSNENMLTSAYTSGPCQGTGATVTFDLSLDTRADSYQILFTSQVTQQTLSVVPVVVTSNPRWVTFEVYNGAGLTAGYVNLYPSGTWNYQVLDNLGNLLLESVMTIDSPCQEAVFYEYVSSNENMLSSVYTSVINCAECPVWNTDPDIWQLDTGIWECY